MSCLLHNYANNTLAQSKLLIYLSENASDMDCFLLCAICEKRQPQTWGHCLDVKTPHIG